MEYFYTSDRMSYRRQTTEELRASFLLDDLFAAGELVLKYTDVDRAIVGSAVPLEQALSLPSHKELGSDFFAQRREVGVVNMGAPGFIMVDGVRFDMANRSSLYVGMGSKEVAFQSEDAAKPARFFITSYPAHKAYPTKLITQEQANMVPLGASETCNERVIYQSICPGVADSCQLVMGFTELKRGSNWNTFPPHTHKRRMEVYAYFDLQDDEVVFHMMGEPDQTRHIIVREGQAVVAPSWSIHSGVGTAAYTFVWAMGGENQVFDDMDHLKGSELA